jgi:hypothetical protein
MPLLEISERYSDLMDAPVRTKDGSHVSSLSLADRAYQHEYFGMQLRTQLPRFSFHFADNSRTVEYIGKDADTIGHMYELGTHVGKLLEQSEVDIDDYDRASL